MHYILASFQKINVNGNVNVHESSKVLNLIREVCGTRISAKNWKSFVSHVIKEEEKFRKTDHVTDNKIEHVIIKYCSSSESDSDSDAEQ